MSKITVEEIELLTFFEVEPKVADLGIPWPYNDFKYQLELGQYSVCFGIAPAYKDLSLSITHGASDLYKLTALSVKDVLYHKEKGEESLEIIVTERESILLKLRPTVSVAQTVASEP